MRARLLVLMAVICAVPWSARAQETPAVPQPPAPIVQHVRLTGARQLSERAILAAAHIHIGEPLDQSPEDVATAIEHRYSDDGYTFARALASFDASSGTLTISVEEGVIDGVEFQGVDERLAREFEQDFALRAGDVFNRDRAEEALRALLRPTRGSVAPGEAAPDTAADPRRVRYGGAFDLVERNGQRILLVGLRQPDGRFHFAPDLGEREDWYTPVDGFVPSFGFGAAVFDHANFNHTFVAGHISFKAASDRVGYALGFERPVFTRQKLFVGGELHDLTAVDEDFRVSGLEASLAAVGPHKSYRDYFRRRGVQLTAAWRVEPRVELLMAWRRERQEPLPTEAEFSFWNGDDDYRPNVAAAEGSLSAMVIGASASSEEFGRESLDRTYRRHQLDTLFGEPIEEWSRGSRPLWQVDWTSEISSPGLNSDFDFRRHIVAGRASLPLSSHQSLALRGLGGWSDGILPPQRQFAIGGVGSVHGYPFNEQIGANLVLLNAEYFLGWRGGLHAIGFFDVGRVEPAAATAEWLKGVGFGIGLDEFRVDFGYRLDAVPSSLQVLVRIGRRF
jgi:outer membrane protein insertion porin family